MGEQRLAAQVKPFEPGVAVRVDTHGGAQFAWPDDAFDAKAGRIVPVLVRGKRAAVERDVDQLQILAIQPQRLQWLAGIWLQLQGRMHQRVPCV